jgi:hypothetical protein
MARKSGVYVLRLNSGGRYYVGSSADVEVRVRNHMTDPKVTWVQESGGVAEAMDPVTPPEEPLSAWEMRETMARMIMHGFNKVRGWEYCSPQPLANSDVDGIFKLICGGLAVPLCHSCGFSGHLSSACETPGRATWLDDLMACRPEKKTTGSDVILSLIREGGTVPRPNQKRRPETAAASVQYVGFDELSVQLPATKRRPACTRCGRVCHATEGCFARTTVNGERLGAASPTA